MATETGHEAQADSQSINWQAGIVGGIAGGIVMGALMLAMNDAVLAVAIPSLYSLAPPPNIPVGLGVHVFHGAALGIIFAGISSTIGLDSSRNRIVLGLAWGIVTWAVLAALLMPVWLSTVGSPASPPFPNFALPSLIWHLVYGLVLGGVYIAAEDWL
ncbi:DUF6789 family protein [Salinigranum halophilum]|uniref:DUF6789 family protein n=1 Tax=Salinigranum halophilum TaxID=2565931 RepID=UPI0010A8B9A0|nr:DUF6789 family protein [Salinigranum halophilum]